jgi:hypothetical protein
LVTKRKYNVGKLVKEQWVFGGFDVNDKIGFMIPVAKRDKRTLEAAFHNIVQHIIEKFPTT